MDSQVLKRPVIFKKIKLGIEVFAVSLDGQDKTDLVNSFLSLQAAQQFIQRNHTDYKLSAEQIKIIDKTVN